MHLTPASDLPLRDDGPPIDETDELLVAYLDGELDEEARRKLEDRLFADDGLRTRLAELQSGWEMLDHLPQATVTEDFARTTLEMVAAGQSKILEARRRRPWRGLAWLALVGTLTALALFAGWWIPRQLSRQQFYAELDELPLANHLDAYLLDVDLDLIVQLSESERWNSAMRLGMEAGGIAVPVALHLEQPEPQQQIEAVRHLDRETQTALSTHWDRLHSLTADQLRRVHQRYEAVHQLAHPDDVLRTMEQYATWWNQLSPEARDRIAKAAPETRLDTVLDTLERTSRNWLVNYGMSLSDSDRDLIYSKLQWMAEDRIAQAKAYVEANAVENDDRWYRSRYADVSPKWLLHRLARNANWEFWQRVRRGAEPDDGGEPQRDASNGAFRDLPTAAPDFADEPARERWLHELLYGPPTDEELAAIEEFMSFVSPRALFVLNGEANSVAQRRATLWRWCVEIILQAAPRGDSTEMMQKVYESLGHEFRDLLDLRPPDELFNELRDRRRRW